jgi:uncharacterized protein YbjT (DUF2867 family)
MTTTIAGITGYTGRHLLPMLADLGNQNVRLLVRPSTAAKEPWAHDPRVVATEQDTAAAVAPHLTGTDTIVCLVGTTRAQFGTGNTYEKVDIAIPRALAQAGKAAGARRFILLSSIGTGSPGTGNAYLRAKAEAEEAVRQSGLSWVIVRPSAFTGTMDDGARSFERKAMGWAGPVMAAFGHIPGLRGPVDDYRPIPVTLLAAAVNKLIRDDSLDGRILTGRDLWALAP